jgi:hypothetical protein
MHPHCCKFSLQVLPFQTQKKNRTQSPN